MHDRRESNTVRTWRPDGGQAGMRQGAVRQVRVIARPGTVAQSGHVARAGLALESVRGRLTVRAGRPPELGGCGRFAIRG